MTFALALLLSAAPPVDLEVESCGPVQRDEVRRLLAIELHAQLAEGTDPAVTRVHLGCDGDRASLHVADPITGKTLDRVIDLSGLKAKARPRLLAVAAAELVTASWTEAELNPTPKVPPAGPPPPAEAREAVVQAVEANQTEALQRDWNVSAHGAARGTLSGPLYGGGAALRYDGFSWGGLSLDADLLHGNTSAPFGVVEQTNLSFALALYAKRATPRFSARAGVGARAGPVWLVGEPFNASTIYGSTLFGVWGGPLMTVGVSLPVGGGFSFEAAAEGGFVVRSVTGLSPSGAPVASVDGLWANVNLGIGWGT